MNDEQLAKELCEAWHGYTSWETTARRPHWRLVAQKAKELLGINAHEELVAVLIGILQLDFTQDEKLLTRQLRQQAKFALAKAEGATDAT